MLFYTILPHFILIICELDNLSESCCGSLNCDRVHDAPSHGGRRVLGCSREERITPTGADDMVWHLSQAGPIDDIKQNVKEVKSFGTVSNECLKCSLGGTIFSDHVLLQPMREAEIPHNLH